MKTIGLIEDDNTLRDIYCQYFTVIGSFDVVFAVSDIVYALDQHTHPDIILLDVNLPSGSGIDAIQPLARISRQVRSLSCRACLIITLPNWPSKMAL